MRKEKHGSTTDRNLLHDGDVAGRISLYFHPQVQITSTNYVSQVKTTT